jgi:hypothetical protein
MILAYLDPGTGSYVLQIVLATLFGGLFALKQSWADLKVWLSSRSADSLRPAETIAQRTVNEIRSHEIARPAIHGPKTAEVR